MEGKKHMPMKNTTLLCFIHFIGLIYTNSMFFIVDLIYQKKNFYEHRNYLSYILLYLQ